VRSRREARAGRRGEARGDENEEDDEFRRIGTKRTATSSSHSPCSTPTGPTAYSSKAFAESSPAWNCGGVSEVLLHRAGLALRGVKLCEPSTAVTGCSSVRHKTGEGMSCDEAKSSRLGWGFGAHRRLKVGPTWFATFLCNDVSKCSRDSRGNDVFQEKAM
jgi:hypothetical protein